MDPRYQRDMAERARKDKEKLAELRAQEEALYADANRQTDPEDYKQAYKDHNKVQSDRMSEEAAQRVRKEPYPDRHALSRKPWKRLRMSPQKSLSGLSLTGPHLRPTLSLAGLNNPP